MITESTIHQLMTSYDGVVVDKRSTDDMVIYSLGGEIVGLVKKGSNPIQLSLRCDTNLAALLKKQYESVLASDQLNKKRFIKLLLTGQLSDQEIKDQIRHAYEETKQIAIQD